MSQDNNQHTNKQRKMEEGNGIGILNMDMDKLNSMIGSKEKGQTEKRIIINEDTDYESDEKQEVTLGPTQGADRPKSIFD
mmetsp:Transcript_481/g.459  ORF Transcript_481/g.459 Transcript_481/m.459 type:complete len:80 (+) Transcript_481:3-242(+)